MTTQMRMRGESLTAWPQACGGLLSGLRGFDIGHIKSRSDCAIADRSPVGGYGPDENGQMVPDCLVMTWFFPDRFCRP